MENFPVTLIFTIAALAVVLALAWLILRFIAGSASYRRGNRLKTIEVMPLGTRERVVLMAVDDKEYLIGVTAGGISVLDPSEAKSVKH